MFKQRKSLIQTAALPFVRVAAEVHVALVTSRGRKRWITPKGWPLKDRPLHVAAAREAEEEAGIVGRIAERPVGAFDAMKRLDAGYDAPCRVFVFPLEAAVQRLDWRERKERRVRWLPIGEAVATVDEKGLARLLAEIAEDPESLRRVAERQGRIAAE